MTATPERKVHWDCKDISPSLLNSPFFENSTESYASTSSLAYINSQLLAHGFTSSPGLSLDGLSTADSEKVIKCFLGMLGQRMEDMSRTEDLSTKLRTLTYDHERLLTMHRTANDKAANAEREANVHKTKLTAALRNLQSSETAHKNTTTELQRTRATIQTLRAGHQSELKKKEKEIERIAERWNKISESQTKLASTPAGLRCANVSISDGSESIGKSQNYLDIALEDAERARSQLTDEVMRLRRLVLKMVNQLQALLYQIRGYLAEKEEAPVPFSMTSLFPMQPPTHAHDTMTTILQSLREALTSLPQFIASSPLALAKPQANVEEVARLQSTIVQLREEIERSQKQTMTHTAETQAMFDDFITRQRKASEYISEISMELMSAPLVDEERKRLDEIKRELEEERERFTQATIKLGKERAAFEADRVKLLDEKRSWEVEKMLADLPPTPNLMSSTNASQAVTKHVRTSPPKKSPRKTPKRISTRKSIRVSRRSSVTPTKAIPPFETEVLPPLPATSFSNLKPAMSILPSFVLPPPSPHASLPNKPVLPPRTSPPGPAGIAIPDLQITSVPDASWSSEAESTTPPTIEPFSLQPAVVTPRQPFPVAKPFAQRMAHAYSPAKPSPLSRILMLGDSPTIPETDGSGRGLEGAQEGDEDEDAVERHFPAIAETPEPPEPRLSLAAELGVESPPEILLNPQIVVKPKKHSAKDGISKLDTKKSSALRTKATKAPTMEKENGIAKASTRAPSATTTSINDKAVRAKTIKSTSNRPVTTLNATVNTRNKMVIKPTSTSDNLGPRRVPINSAEAPLIARKRS